MSFFPSDGQSVSVHLYREDYKSSTDSALLYLNDGADLVHPYPKLKQQVAK